MGTGCCLALPASLFKQRALLEADKAHLVALKPATAGRRKRKNAATNKR
jgi:hypothetical protein